MVQKGDRIELVHTDDEYTNLKQKSKHGEGAKGTVTGTDIDSGSITPSGRPERKIWIDWDNGGKLALIAGKDRFEKIDED
jgi:hypothetical protein